MAQDSLRLDKWLWHARFFKTRTLAAKVAQSGRTRVNGNRIAKPSHAIKIGDVLTFVQAKEVRVVRVLAFSERRGPATEAQTLYAVIEDSASSGRTASRFG